MLGVALALAVADPVPPTPAAQASVAAAVAVVRSYYAAIAHHDYVRAWHIWSGGHGLAAFRKGYAHTACVAVFPQPPFRAEPGAGNVYATINVVVRARLDNGARQRFAGAYVLHRVNDVPGSSAADRRWHIVSAHLKAQ